eukprot:JP439078.1.p1 GENE.JP439078.1~~JP439078.1.p1  ORF type:complete len:74 (+),score=16.34 JP439078.1:2-223(+)
MADAVRILDMESTLENQSFWEAHTKQSIETSGVETQKALMGQVVKKLMAIDTASDDWKFSAPSKLPENITRLL